MQALSNMGRSLKNSLGLDTEEQRPEPSCSADSHERGRSVAENTTVSEEISHCSHNCFPRDTAERAHEPNMPQGDWQAASQRPSCETASDRKKVLTEVNGDSHIKLTECKLEVEAREVQQNEFRQEYSKLLAENGALKQENQKLSRRKDAHKLDARRYKYLVEEFVLPYAHDKSLQYDDRSLQTIDSVLQPMLQDAKNADALQDQVDELQRSLLERVANKNAISDQQFAQDFRGLVAKVKSLSRLLCTYNGVDIVGAFGIHGIAHGSTPHQWRGRGGPKQFLELWIWSVLVEAVFWEPFAIFGEEGQVASNLWFSMFHGDQDHYGWPVPSTASEDWRQATMEQLSNLIDVEILTRGKEKENYLWLEKRVVDARANTVRHIERGLNHVAPKVDLIQVRHIVDKACTLAMQMALQQARLQVTYPRIGSMFNSLEMLTVDEDDEENPDHGVVALVFHPGLTKWGDAHGKNFNHRFDIVPALVQLEHTEVKRE